MKVSFIVPLYNCLPLTQAMVESLQATLPAGLEHEILLVDDGSTDGTRDWIAGLGAPFRVLLNERNSGYAASNNRGAAAATGELLLLLNNDLVLQPGWLEPMLALHRRLGSAAGVVGNVQREVRSDRIDHAGIFINLKGKPEHLREEPHGWRELFTRVHYSDAVTGACLLVKRSLWNEIGGFDEGFVNGCEDVDLCLRAKAAGNLTAVALGSVVRHHVSSASGRKDRDEQNTRRLTLRWRKELAACAARRWSKHYYAAGTHDPQDHGGRFDLQVWLHAIGWRRTPPQRALDTMDAAIAIELARWEEMFGPIGALTKESESQA
jgi:GT2 family glycosyltransferase